ncbi:acyl carrier protein phosphodiesterase [Anditalea andensis]|uniref:ACP phosphodiesterase n=1 Tax=Anditalea andensis TaxID=1048983 RepID=A0A074L3Q5_9BACT|nr:ACP phosphodiesterase [Anditalea andensis]KEO74483.1 ACP phosphodiesterase [Anditalea andensis]
MNFLAHAYLSFGDPKVLIGNYIGDFVRGDLTKTYEPEIIIGVQLHREIDTFTDTHPVVKEAQSLLRPIYARYSTVITDMYFDHFLSKFWEEYHPVPIDIYAAQVYEILNGHKAILPPNFLIAFDMMVSYNWLVSYGRLDGIRDAMIGVSKRTSFNSKMETAHLFLEENYDVLLAHFKEFFPLLVTYSKERFEALKESV